MSILQRSVSTGILIIIIVISRYFLINKLPKTTFKVLWGIAILKLLIPFSVTSEFSVYNLFHISIWSVQSTIRRLPDISQNRSLSSSYIIGNITASRMIKFNLIEICWGIGLLALVTLFIVAFYKSYKELQTALPIKNNPIINEWLSGQRLHRNLKIMVSDRITTPLAYGLLHPKIILPKSMDFSNQQQINYILTHELVHIKSFDILWKVIMILCLCFHWFNPMVWVMYIIMNRDIELACDEKVIKIYGETTKSDYALALINMAEERNKFNPLYSGFSRNSIEERIVSIMKLKKVTILNIAFAFILVIGTTAVFATTANATRKNGNENIIMDKEIGYREIKEGTSVILSSVILDDKTGKMMVSVDEGKTWMTEEEFEEAYPSPKVEWYTYDEYKSWLDEEKKVLQQMVDDGEKGWNPSDGWFVWTQERADEAIRRYEQILEDIKKGTLVSKLVDGEDSVMMSFIPSNVGISINHSTLINFDDGELVEFGPYETKEEMISAVKLYTDREFKAGRITKEEADEIYKHINK